MKIRVLDTWPILEWMNGRQPATGTVQTLFDQSAAGGAQLFMSAINAGEVFYVLRKLHSERLAESWRNSSGTLPVTIDVPTLNEIWDAALLKGRHPISYADAFAAALAQKHRCALVTGDPDFRAVAHLELDWIGQASN